MVGFGGTGFNYDSVQAMYVKQRRNASGSISVQIIEKEEGHTRLIETIGCTSDNYELERLVNRAKQRISELRFKDQLSLPLKESFFIDEVIEEFLEGAELSVTSVGPELILGNLFDRLGFNQIGEPLFRDIVLARLVYPVSKLRTTEYLLYHRNQDIDVSKIYRFLDRLQSKHKDTVEQIAFNYAKSILGKVSVVFYDMTTLYFEAEKEDELRKIGFSKDGKFQKPQIMLGLLVGRNGYPIAYDIYEGNTFEGETLIPALEATCEKFGLHKPVIIADSALLSKKNITSLQEQNYKYILGARIKNESNKVKNEILNKAQNLIDNQIFSIDKEKDQRLIVHYSNKRAKKDASNRERGIVRLQKLIRSGRLTKKSINNRGYNKFLVLDGHVNISIDPEKIENDRRWDGLKGYITNSQISPATVISNYSQLWQIEKAFRISKTDLRIRPIYHRKKNRIEAHICIAFVAYTIYKELERTLAYRKIPLSTKKALELMKTIYKIHFTLPQSKQIHTTFARLSNEQKILLKAFS